MSLISVIRQPLPFWDLNGRNHEITLLKIKHIKIKENYGEGESST
ncbi:MAG TPA: hypothetical protein VE548_08305 [Nitrososphaeraceae archaeon]|jgi:hypothetical protein|nr:hypothetical protein [Nitrososphaeraceae archaeon]